MGADRGKWPLMVRLGLWGLNSRNVAMGFFFIALLGSIGCLAYGLVDHRFLLGGVFLFAALWYYLSIRWVDQNDRWS